MTDMNLGPGGPAINATGFGGNFGLAGVTPLNLPTGASPNIGNLFVGRGFLSGKLQTDTVYHDLGNCTRFTIQVEPTRLDHFSSRIGVRKKDLTVVTQLASTLTMSLEELTARNMAIFLLGQPLESGAITIDLMANPLFYMALQFTATNAVGPLWNFTFPNVLITPSAPLQLIAEGSGTWGALEMTGDVQYDQASQQYGWAWSSTAHD